MQPNVSKKVHLFKCTFDVQITMDRCEEFLKSKGVTIMARVDHAKGADLANLKLRPTQTLIFGNPQIGTHLMLANQSIAIDLPLRLAVWQDEKGSVWLGHPDLDVLAESYGINEPNIIEKMKTALQACVQSAIAT